MVLAGGTEAAIIPLNIAAFAAMRALSTRNDEPERASRPFDKGRDGFVLGEGAGMVVLESAEHAPHADARCTRSPPGPATPPTPTTSPSPTRTGPASSRAIQRRARRRRPEPRPRSSTSTRTPPPPRPATWSRRQAIAAALGDAASGVVVSATKSMTGHLLGGAGAVESVATILALRDRVAPPTINLDDPDDELGVDIATEPRTCTPRGSEPMAALNNSFGFGGHNVALAFTAA